MWRGKRAATFIMRRPWPSLLLARGHRPDALLVRQDKVAADARADGGEGVDHEFPSAGLESRASKYVEPAHQRQNGRKRIKPHFEGQPGLSSPEHKQADGVPHKLDEDA